MKEFFMNLVGYATIVVMIISVIYTWAKLNYEIKRIEKVK